MINDQLSRLNTRTLWRTGLILGALVAAAVIGTISLPPRMVLILLLAVPVVVTSVVLISSESALVWGYGLWIVTLIIGWRGLWWTTNLRFYAPELVICGIFILLLTRFILYRRPIRINVPLLLLILILPLGLLSVYVAFNNSRPTWLQVRWDIVWSSYKPFLIAIPIFAVTSWIVTDMKRWKMAILVFTVIFIIVAVLGAVEYVTGTSLNIFGSTDAPTNFTNQEGLTRADFTFWGHNTVVILIFIAFMTGLLPQAEATHYRHWPTLLGLALAGVGIYVAGQRGTLLATALAVTIFIAFDVRHRWFLVLPFVVVLLLAPDTLLHSFEQVFVGTDQLVDNSLITRVNYSTNAMKLIQNSPFVGNGWGASGWVHNDFLELAADQGIPALVIFAGWYIKTGLELFLLALRSNIDPSVRRLAVAMLATLAGLVITMATQVVLVLAPLAPGFWFFMALIVQFIKLNRPSKRSLSTSGLTTRSPSSG